MIYLMPLEIGIGFFLIDGQYLLYYWFIIDVYLYICRFDRFFVDGFSGFLVTYFHFLTFCVLVLFVYFFLYVEEEAYLVIFLLLLLFGYRYRYFLSLLFVFDIYLSFFVLTFTSLR